MLTGSEFLNKLKHFKLLNFNFNTVSFDRYNTKIILGVLNYFYEGFLRPRNLITAGLWKNFKVTTF